VEILIQDYSKPLLYLITDRHLLPSKKNKSPLDHLVDFIAAAVAGGVDLVQIRERDLSARQLFELTRSVADLAPDDRAAILINDRADLAAACGVGVHLTTRSMPVAAVRKAFGERLLIGASTHSLAEAREAEEGGANFVVFGPVFETLSKKIYGPPVGLEALEAVATNLAIPVLALGGIKLTNFRKTLVAGAAGVAAISLFTEAEDLPGLIQEIKMQR
jgi:thiamine-phosphate pyrophosphorylase